MPASAEAQEHGLRNDLQCFLTTSQMQGSSDPQVRAVGMIGAMFFAGKIFGASPNIDLEAALENVARELSGGPQPMLERCGKEMEQRGNQIQAVGRQLAAKGL